MATYLIDAHKRLWRIDREGYGDFNTVPVERPAGPHFGQRETDRMPLDNCVVDPTDQELAELAPEELSRFGMTRESLLNEPLGSLRKLPRSPDSAE